MWPNVLYVMQSIYIWLPEHDNAALQAFEHCRSAIVKNVVNKIATGRIMGIGSHRMFWKAQYWVTDENFQRRSAIGKQNWVADAETPLYMGEFVSIPVHHERLMKEKQRLPTTFEVVEVTKKTDWE